MYIFERLRNAKRNMQKVKYQCVKKKSFEILLYNIFFKEKIF